MVYRCIGLSAEKALIDVFNQAKIEVVAVSHPMGNGEAVLDTTEHDKEVRADERRKFAEWLTKSNYANGYFDTENGFVSVDRVLAEYEKEQK